MQVRGAVVKEVGQQWSVEDMELDEPRDNEILVRVIASGVCHSDYHLVTGDQEQPLPLVGGHEGAGIVEAVGPGVTRVRPGDHIATAYIPGCGRCEWCARGMQYICDTGANVANGMLLDDTARFHLSDGSGIGAMQRLGTYANWMVISEDQAVKIDDDLPFDRACLVACGVTTGWGTSVNAAKVRPGDTVLIIGTGGVGMNAVQGAKLAGAANIFAVDSEPSKHELAKSFGATHTARTIDEALDEIRPLTNGQGADSAIVTIGVASDEIISSAFGAIRKEGTCVVVSVGLQKPGLSINPFELTVYAKTLRGALFGNSNPTVDIPRLLKLYRSGHIKLDELVTKTYPTDGINDAYADMLEGRNIRGVILHDH
ncbi:Zn-dependent alcohol dehydrogenase [Saccharopolyspora sp. NPDC049426]|uniref:Zn-dependent alcohol dehydrogenase n=1 Tax=Saccharopolyspora sp. NPDC049426 TaxID=3155652 RepID=UPI0034151AD4